MLPKKLLSLSLAAGLAIGFSLNAFAVNEQCEFNGSTVNIAKNDAEIVKEFDNMLAIPAAIQFFVAYVYDTIALTLAPSTAKAIYEFCNTYNKLAKFNNFEDSPCMDDICLDILKMELCVKFENLYKNIPAFQEAFDDAWRVGAKKDRQKYASAPVRSTPRGSKTGFGPSEPSCINKRLSKFRKHSSKANGINKRSSNFK